MSTLWLVGSQTIATHRAQLEQGFSEWVIFVWGQLRDLVGSTARSDSPRDVPLYRPGDGLLNIQGRRQRVPSRLI
jgi:hypothetical protein